MRIFGNYIIEVHIYIIEHLFVCVYIGKLNKKNLVISTKFSLQIIFFWGRIVFMLLSKLIGTPGLEPAARMNGSCSLPIGGGVPVAVLLIRCRPECHSKAGFSLDHRTSESFPAKHINAAYPLSSNSTFGHRYGTNQINRQAVTPGSRLRSIRAAVPIAWRFPDSFFANPYFYLCLQRFFIPTLEVHRQLCGTFITLL